MTENKTSPRCYSPIVCVQGEQGDDGQMGLPGKPGHPGTTGVIGLPGSQGSIGPKVTMMGGQYVLLFFLSLF